MQAFARLIRAIDATAATNAKVRALRAYFRAADPRDGAWALYLLLGKTRRRTLSSRQLRAIFLGLSELPEWLFEESYAHVGDSAETIALLLPLALPDRPLRDRGAETPSPEGPSSRPLHEWMEDLLPQVKALDSDAAAAELVKSWWSALDDFEAFVLNKILTGAFRIGVSQKLAIRALAAEFDLPEAVLAHRLMGDFAPSADFFRQLIDPETASDRPSQPYPFFLASPLDADRFFAAETPDRWQAEWKWDGIRAQIVRRAGETFIWSRGEDAIAPQFPELAEGAAALPDGTVLDGEILCWQGDRPLNFNHLQARLGRKRVTAKLKAENPVRFLAYDLLETDGEDWRDRPLYQRRSRLEAIVSTLDFAYFSPSKCLAFSSWAALRALRDRARAVGAEGVMLKERESPYLVGRKRGFWWKYKLDPMTLDAVLIYAQAGSGKRANLFTDYTFALWKDGELVPFAKAYSGLDNAEIEALDRWIRRHTLDRFGPVRSVEPARVFEIGFEGIARSKRHKSGIAVRFPRILRERSDKRPKEADSLQAALDLLDA